MRGEPFQSCLELLWRSAARQAVLPLGEVAMASPACLSSRIADLPQRLVGGCIQTRKGLLCSPDQTWGPFLDDVSRPHAASVPGQPTGCLDAGPPDRLSLLGALWQSEGFPPGRFGLEVDSCLLARDLHLPWALCSSLSRMPPLRVQFFDVFIFKEAEVLGAGEISLWCLPSKCSKERANAPVRESWPR